MWEHGREVSSRDSRVDAGGWGGRGGVRANGGGIERGGVFFFFQAEDGIRDYKVTGVQTCALPILVPSAAGGATSKAKRMRSAPCSSYSEPFASEPPVVGVTVNDAEPAPPSVCFTSRDRKSVV